MKSYFRLAAIAAAFLLSPAFAQTPAPSHPPVEAFATLPEIGDPALSPDGKHLALIQTQNGRPVATIWNLDPRISLQAVIPNQEGFIVGVHWANDHRLLITVNLNRSVRGSDTIPWFRTIAVDPDGKNPATMFGYQRSLLSANTSSSSIIDIAPDDPDHVYMSMYARTTGEEYRNTVYRVDVNTGEAVIAERGTKDTSEWFSDGTGHIVARVDTTEKKSDTPITEHIMVLDPNKEWREIASMPMKNGKGYDIEGVSEDGKSLVMKAGADAKGTRGLISLALADGKVTALCGNPNYDVEGGAHDPWSRRVIGAFVVTQMPKVFYFDPQNQAQQEALERAFPHMSVLAMASDRAKQKIVVRVSGPSSPPAFYLYTRQTNKLDPLGHTYAQIKPSDLGEVKIYDYAARDGLKIPAYLTLPVGKVAKNLPVVVMPHGGPEARDDMDFDYWSQFLANRGYAVLRPNFRGSDGYGTTFVEAGYGEWGHKMQDDVSDGVKKLIADGIADPKRVCIVGWSYGGYAALAGATLSPDLYACTIAGAGVSDLRLILATEIREHGRDSGVLSYWNNFIGDRWSNADKLDAVSPAKHAANVKGPVLLVHGEDDYTVRIDQSETMEDALKAAGKKVTFLRIPKETHYLQSQSTRQLFLSEMEKFLKENIGN